MLHIGIIIILPFFLYRKYYISVIVSTNVIQTCIDNNKAKKNLPLMKEQLRKEGKQSTETSKM